MSISIGFSAIRSWKVSRSPELQKKSIKTPYLSVQGHPRSLKSAAIESQCMTSY